MRRSGQNRMLSFSQDPVSTTASYSYGVEQRWYYHVGSSSNGGQHPSKSYRRSHDKEQREAQRRLTKVEKEWMKVKEELGYAKMCGEHLTEVLVETNKKLAAMLAYLDQTDKYVQYLMARTEQLQGYC